MGLKDKLINFFRNAIDLFSEDLSIEKPKSVSISKVEKTFPPKQKSNIVLTTRIPEASPADNSSIKPHELYAPKSTNTYYSDADVFSARQPQKTVHEPIRQTTQQVTPEQKTIQASSQAFSSSSYNTIPQPPKNESFNSYLQTISPKSDQKTNSYVHESKFQKSEDPIFRVDQKREKSFPKPKLKPLCEYVNRKITLDLNNLSLPIIVPTADKQILLLQKSPNEKKNDGFLIVKNGDFVANLSYVNKSTSKFSVAIYKGEKVALTSRKNFVFGVKSEVMDKDFLELLIQDLAFDEKLSFLTYKYAKNNRILWNNFANNLLLNVPSLKVQKDFLEKKKALQELIKVKQSINNELDRWMKNYFRSLSTGKQWITKSCRELFSIDKKASSTIPKLKNLKNQYGKFIFSSFKELIIKRCPSCYHNFCCSDRLLLSNKVYGEEEQKHILNLWLGCSGFSSSANLISLEPHKSLGIPYGYWLIRENLSNLVKNVVSIVSKRTVSITELRNFDFQVHSQEKIREFNKTCNPIFEYQQLLEEEIYKLTRLQEREIDFSLLKTFSKKIPWNLSK